GLLADPLARISELGRPDLRRQESLDSGAVLAKHLLHLFPFLLRKLPACPSAFVPPRPLHLGPELLRVPSGFGAPARNQRRALPRRGAPNHGELPGRGDFGPSLRRPPLARGIGGLGLESQGFTLHGLSAPFCRCVLARGKRQGSAMGSIRRI